MGGPRCDPMIFYGPSKVDSLPVNRSVPESWCISQGHVHPRGCPQQPGLQSYIKGRESPRRFRNPSSSFLFFLPSFLYLAPLDATVCERALPFCFSLYRLTPPPWIRKIFLVKATPKASTAVCVPASILPCIQTTNQSIEQDGLQSQVFQDIHRATILPWRPLHRICP